MKLDKKFLLEDRMGKFVEYQNIFKYFSFLNFTKNSFEGLFRYERLNRNIN